VVAEPVPASIATIIDIQVSVDHLGDESKYGQRSNPSASSWAAETASIGASARSRGAAATRTSMSDRAAVFGSAGTSCFATTSDTDAAARVSYAIAKAEIASRWRDDRIAYADAKTEIIERLMARAEARAGPEGR